MTEAWVDGSFHGSSCGWAFVVLEDGEFLCEDYGSDVPTEFLSHRNVAGEIFAVLRLLDFCKENEITCIDVYHDYTGLEAWAEGTFKTNTVLTRYYSNYVKSSGISVSWHKIESHTGDTWNEYADKLAKYAIGRLEEAPELPVKEAAPAAAPREELDETIDIYSLKHINLRQLLEKKQEQAAEQAPEKAAEPAEAPEKPGEEIPQPVMDIPQMAYGTVKEASSGETPRPETTAEAFEKAKELMEQGDCHEARLMLKPFVNNSLSDGEIAFYLSVMTECSCGLARKAAATAERVLRLRHGSRPLQREYCRALYKGHIVPCLVSLSLTDEEYRGGREACMALLAVSTGSPVIIDMLLPFMRLAARMGDRDFLSRVGKQVNPAVISAAPIRINGIDAMSKRLEFLQLIK